MGMVILPVQDANGKDVVILWGQVVNGPKVINMVSKKSGKPMSKTRLYVRYGDDDSETINVDAWFALGDICEEAMKGDYFFGVGLIGEDTWQGKTSLKFTTGGGTMRYGFVSISHKLFGNNKPKETFKETTVPTDVFADLQQGGLPF